MPVKASHDSSAGYAAAILQQTSCSRLTTEVPDAMIRITLDVMWLILAESHDILIRRRSVAIAKGRQPEEAQSGQTWSCRSHGG